MKAYADGWYASKDYAKSMLDYYVAAYRVEPIGILEGVHGMYAVIYKSEGCIFKEHEIPGNVI